MYCKPKQNTYLISHNIGPNLLSNLLPNTNHVVGFTAIIYTINGLVMVPGIEKESKSKIPFLRDQRFWLVLSAIGLLIWLLNKAYPFFPN